MYYMLGWETLFSGVHVCGVLSVSLYVILCLGSLSLVSQSVLYHSEERKVTLLFRRTCMC